MRAEDRLVLNTARAAGPAGAGLVLLALVEPVTRLALPGLLGSSVDTAIAGRPMSTSLVLLLVVLAVGTLTEIARESWEVRAEVTGTRWLRSRVLRHLLSLGGDGRRHFAVGDVLSRLLESARTTATGISAMVIVLTSVCTSLGGLVALFWIDVWLGALFLVGAPAMWMLTRWLIRRVGAMTTTYQRLSGELASRFVDAVRGARSIRAHGTVDREVDRILAPLPELEAAGGAFWETQRKAMWQAGLLAPVLQIGVLAVGGFAALAGRISPGELLAAQGYLTYAQGLLKQTALLARLAVARGSAQRLRELLDVPVPASGLRHLPSGPGRLSLRGVRVRYGERWVLDGVNLDLPPGRSIAIVGASGAGKSTLTEVAGGLLTPDEGRVLLDGVPLSEVDPRELRSAFAFAFECPHLLGETLADALAYSDRTPSPRRVGEALRSSAAEGFVRRLPEGERTPLRDLRLSGGERQRLGLARAVARRARVVVLDDVTSSVDTATEVQIGAALERALRGTTRLIVAHRMSAAERADAVVWLHGGVVRAFAHHDELMEHPEYRAVFQPRRPSLGRDSAVERARDPELTMEMAPLPVERSHSDVRSGRAR
ncbi:ATP-binding cassette subfamily B protein [Saccharopolyspora dendranthemae]|uniref:ATP-binding cassette subfamily B protein n=1 Tax=Saccharopolyspora dendranthemae TaxID=1181886 RepID=A0A561V9R0_9PSEU|nr:ATP-binding cassette subfamily B protein [Saccharopolyspora dendranthemae]